MELQSLNKCRGVSSTCSQIGHNGETFRPLLINLRVNVEEVAKAVVRECDGLPLGIVTMAGSMRGVDDMHEWQNALTELRRSEMSLEDMGDKVFRVLGFSYSRLNDWGLQQCVLYCTLFPEDHEIDREELIQLLVAEGIIDRRERRQVDFDKGHAMLNKLIKVSLLEDVTNRGSGTYVKMHDLIRDMAIQIMKKSCPSIVEAGRQLKHMPEDKYWTKDIMRVSLMKNDMEEIPSEYSPICHNLSTLLLSNNYDLASIPDSFFLQLHGLKVLDLSFCQVTKLPQSVGCLGNLKVMLLRNCGRLYDMPSMVKLVSLETLDLSFCSALKVVPEGLEMLSTLTQLNLHGSGIVMLQPGMIKRLSHLQYLACGGLKGHWSESNTSNEDSFGVKAEELAELKKLECLSWRFDDSREYNKYLQLICKMRSSTQPCIYFLSVGRSLVDTDAVFPKGVNSREVFFRSCGIGREVFIFESLCRLIMEDVTVTDASGLCFKNVSEMSSSKTKLKSLSIFITSCVGIKYLFDLSSSPSMFKNLETLDLNYINELCALFGSEEVPPSTPLLFQLPAATFSCLKQFRIINCNGIKKLFPAGLMFNFKSMEKFVVGNCSEMEEIVAEDGGSSNLMEAQFILPKLKHLILVKFPKLRSICSAEVICDSNPEITIGDCPKLKKIPISLSRLSPQTLRLRVWTPEWWESVEWGSPDQKSLLHPQFDSLMYGRKIFRVNYF